MENGNTSHGDDDVGVTRPRWRFSRSSVGSQLAAAGTMSIRAVLDRLNSSLDASATRPVVQLAQGDPTASACYQTAPEAEDAVVDALLARKHNGYSSTMGVPHARSAIAEYLSRDLPYELSPDDIYLTSGCVQAVEIMISVLAQPGANILLPKPGFPLYESRTMFSHLEDRHFDLIPERGWQVDLQSVKALADENTVAIVIINPGNPCGSVYSHDHLAQGAVPKVIANTKQEYFDKILGLLRSSADLCYSKIKDIRGITCPHKPEGSMFVMVKLDISCLVGFSDDVDFCCRLAKEESVLVMPGTALGMKDCLRITFAIDLPSLEDGLERVKSFCERHGKVEA